MILLKGNYGNNNLGDDLLARAIYQRLKDITKVRILYNKYESTPKDIEVSFFPIVPKKRILKFLNLIKMAIHRNDVIYGGGSQIQVCKGINNIRFTVALLKLFRCKVAFFSVGIEQIDLSSKNLKILKKIIEMSDFFSVRDSNSFNLINKLSISKEVFLSSDPVLAYNPHRQLTKKPNDKKNLRVLFIPMDYPALYSLCDGMISVFEQYNHIEKISIDIIPFAKVDDYAVAKLYDYLTSILHADTKIYKYDFTYSFELVEPLFISADYIVSGRLHGGIMATVFNKPLVYCASIERNYMHNRNLAIDMGYNDYSIVSDVKFAYNSGKDFIINPDKYINNHECVRKSIERLEQTYSVLIKSMVR